MGGNVWDSVSTNDSEESINPEFRYTFVPLTSGFLIMKKTGYTTNVPVAQIVLYRDMPLESKRVLNGLCELLSEMEVGKPKLDPISIPSASNSTDWFSKNVK